MVLQQSRKYHLYAIQENGHCRSAVIGLPASLAATERLIVNVPFFFEEAVVQYVSSLDFALLRNPVQNIDELIDLLCKKMRSSLPLPLQLDVIHRIPRIRPTRSFYIL